MASSYTYYGTSELIALPNRTVQTYPSGLVRVERSFVCRRDSVTKFRDKLKVGNSIPDDDGAPAIDGLYIFPEPQEILRDDGFVEFRVTAYGRTNEFSDAAIEKSSIKSTFTRYTFGLEAEVITSEVSSINDIFILRGVVPSSAPATDFLKLPNVSNLLIYDLSSGSILKNGEIKPPFPGSTSGGTIIFLSLDGYTSSNFGSFSEYAITWRANAQQRVFYPSGT